MTTPVCATCKKPSPSGMYCEECRPGATNARELAWTIHNLKCNYKMHDSKCNIHVDRVTALIESSSLQPQPNMEDIGTVRRRFFAAVGCKWNGLVRDITAKLERDGQVDSEVVAYALIEHCRRQAFADAATAELRQPSVPQQVKAESSSLQAPQWAKESKPQSTEVMARGIVNDLLGSGNEAIGVFTLLEARLGSWREAIEGSILAGVPQVSAEMVKKATNGYFDDAWNAQTANSISAQLAAQSLVTKEKP